MTLRKQPSRRLVSRRREPVTLSQIDAQRERVLSGRKHPGRLGKIVRRRRRAIKKARRASRG